MSAEPQVAPADKRLAPYLTVEQVGEMLQLSAKSIYRLSKADPSMPMLKLGGTVRFPRERLERWLRDREQGRPRTRSLSAVSQNRTPDQENAGA
jgi:excisionase family DNA binding protein